MTALEILVNARALIATPEKWTKTSSARDVYGWEVPPHDPRAACFCASGAMISVDPSRGYVEYRKASDALDAAVPPEWRGAVMGSLKGVRNFVTYNDAPTTTHADVLAMFGRAIAALQVAT